MRTIGVSVQTLTPFIMDTVTLHNEHSVGK